MNNFFNASWIDSQLIKNEEDVILYKKSFSVTKKLVKAELYITACGVYVAYVNEKRVSMPLAPGFDSYKFRLAYQVYEVTNCIREFNQIRISVGKGWFGWYRDEELRNLSKRRGVKALIKLTYEDSSVEYIPTDDTWFCCYHGCQFSDIYNGEVYCANKTDSEAVKVDIGNSFLDENLFLFDGEPIIEKQRIKPINSFITPKGEYVIDFGQNLTGYVEFSIDAKEGEVIEISHAEVLDKYGNFYNENYRKAKAKITYVCKQGFQDYKPLHTFFGFRYIRLDKKPAGVTAENFTAVTVCSDLIRTGYVQSSNELLNRLFENVIWSQQDNFLDIPSDCPQRDERQGWTGDAQLFCKCATYNFDCENFFARWLRNMLLEHKFYGFTPDIVPDILNYGSAGFTPAWSDASTIIPWTLFNVYGNKNILNEFYPLIKGHVDSITSTTCEPDLWVCEKKLGDWLHIGDIDEYANETRGEFIASAFYAYSVSLLINSGRILNQNIDGYQNLYNRIIDKFRKTFKPRTQTECALAIVFSLSNDIEETAKTLVDSIKRLGGVRTGFIGTPYILHALTICGNTELAYELLLREQYPSWLYPVKLGATTVWERWDGIKNSGDFASPGLNSFNHYAYGSALDWVYGVAGGITPLEAGYSKVKINPHPSNKLHWLKVSFLSRHGKILVEWKIVDNTVNYHIETPVDSLIIIDGKENEMKSGIYEFQCKLKGE